MKKWKNIKGLDFPYQVSDSGDIRNLDYRGTGKVRGVKSHLDHKGYRRVGLMVDGKQKWFRVHRLVAEYFIPNSENKSQVNHKDEDKVNNSIENLEWVTNKENSNHGTKGKRIATSHKKLGTYQKLARMKSMPVIGTSLTDGEKKHYKSIRATAEDGFNPGCVSNVLKGRAHTHKKHLWEYM